MVKSRITKGICILLTLVLMLGMISVANPAADAQLAEAALIYEEDSYTDFAIVDEVGFDSFVEFGAASLNTIDQFHDDWDWNWVKDWYSEPPPPTVYNPPLDEGYYITDGARATGLVTITFRSTGHTGGTLPAIQRVPTPGGTNLPFQGTLRRSGSSFGGWRHSSGLIYSPGAPVSWGNPITGPLTLYTHWVATNLSIGQSTWNPGSGASSLNLGISTNYHTWVAHVNNNPNWVTVNWLDMRTARINVNANTGAARSATVRIIAGTVERTITINQAAGAAPAPTLAVSHTAWSPGSGIVTSTNMTITSNTAWTISSNQTWLVPSITSGSNNANFTLRTTSANPNTTTRSATVTIRTANGALSHTINVIQAASAAPAPTLTINPSANWTNVPSAGSTRNITVTTNQASWSASSSHTWLRLNRTTGTTGTTLTLTADPNQTTATRSATVTITAPNGAPMQQVTVTQVAPAATLTLSPTTWNPGSGAANQTISVTSNRTWTVSSNVTWLTISNVTPANRVGDGSFRINAVANTEPDSRVGTITVTAPGATTRTVTVTQAAPAATLVLSATSWNPGSGAANQTINVMSNRTWTVSSNVTWLTISNVTPANRVGDGSFRINATTNTGPVSRTGVITATAPGATTRTVEVTQAAASPNVTVTFNGNGNTGGSPPASIVVTTPGSIRVPGHGTMTRPGYTFIGWRNAQNNLFRPDDPMIWIGTTSGTVALTAYWVQNITIRYDVITNTTLAPNTAQAWVNSIHRYFLNEFGIVLINNSRRQSAALNPREIDIESACRRPDDVCNELCGRIELCVTTHHRSAGHLLNLYRSTSNLQHVHRFVDYRICWHGSFDGVIGHGEVLGLGDVRGSNMLVTSRSGNVLRTVAHEISHNLGAPDHNCNPGQPCVLSHYFHDTHNEWCNRHRENIMNHRSQLQ